MLGLHWCAANVDGHKFLRGEEIVAPAKQGSNGIGSGAAAGPSAGSFLRQEPHLKGLDGVLVAGYFIKSLDHDRLRRDWSISPAPPARMRIPPPHSLPVFLFVTGLHIGIHGPLFEAVDDRERRIAFAGTHKRDCHVPLRATGIQLHPRFLANIETPSKSGRGLPLRRRVFLEEASGVEGVSTDGSQHDVVQLSRPYFFSPLLLLDQPAVEPRDRLQCWLNVNFNSRHP